MISTISEDHPVNGCVPCIDERGEGHDKKFSRVHLKIVKIDITVHKLFSSVEKID